MSCAFHPDGHLFAAGTETGDIKIFETKTGQLAATFTLGPPVDIIAFSENGYWFAAASKGEPSVTIFDLRKTGEAARVKEFQTTGGARTLAWDNTAQYLAISSTSGTTVQQYLKSSKSWTEPLRNSVAAADVKWGPDAKSLVTIAPDGVVSVLGAKE